MFEEQKNGPKEIGFIQFLLAHFFATHGLPRLETISLLKSLKTYSRVNRNFEKFHPSHIFKSLKFSYSNIIKIQTIHKNILG